MATVKVLIATSATRTLTDHVCAPICNHTALAKTPKSYLGLSQSLCKTWGGLLRNKFLFGCFSESVKCLPLSFSKQKFRSILQSYGESWFNQTFIHGNPCCFEFRTFSKQCLNEDFGISFISYLNISTIAPNESLLYFLCVLRPICNTFSPLLLQMVLYLTAFHTHSKFKVNLPNMNLRFCDLKV